MKAKACLAGELDVGQQQIDTDGDPDLRYDGIPGGVHEALDLQILLDMFLPGDVMPSKLLFLPGASGNTEFWMPAANLLMCTAEKVFMQWPGFGSIPPDSEVNSMDDLVVAEIDQPVAIIAQSTGCIMVIRAALEELKLITHLVLAVTSGGMDLEPLRCVELASAFVCC